MTGGRHPPIDDKLRLECGVFGIFGHDAAAAHTVLGLHALQHRGQEAAGVVSFDGRLFHSHRVVGLVGDHFSSEAVIGALPGHAAIGHVRYSTAGAPLLRNVQPLFADFAFGGLALGHNGNLTNALTLRRELVEQGCLFQSTSDTEVIIHLIARSRQPTVVERLVDALGQVEGAYALVALSGNALYGVRDPLGVRPLVLGELDGAPIFASETCALDIMGARFIRDVAPGEVVTVTADGIESLTPFPRPPKRFCIFEYVYFARPDSSVEGQSVYETRKRIGAELAKEHPSPADLVIPVPDSGVPAAIGYAQAAGLPFELGLIRNHYVGRTFIEPSDRIRHLGVKLKHNANRATVAGKRVVLVDEFDRPRHDLDQDRRDDPAGGCHRGPHAGREPADHPLLLLWRRHPRSGRAAGGPEQSRGDGPDHRRRQPGLSLDRRPLPRGRRAAARSRAAALLRCLLQRRLPDPARGPGPGRLGGPAVADARGRLSWPICPDASS